MLFAVFVACFLAWRLRNPESHIVASIKEAGGKAIYGYQFEHIFEGSMRFRSRPVIATNSKPEPSLTLEELVFGDLASHRIQAVELPLERVTPELITKLESLQHLNYLIVVHSDIPEMQFVGTTGSKFEATRYPFDFSDPELGKTLRKLERKFGIRLLYQASMLPSDALRLALMRFPYQSII